MDIPIICPAIFSAVRRGTNLTKKGLEKLLSLGDNKLDIMAPLLPLFPGLPVYITQNLSPKLGLANGSTGTVLGYQFAEDTVFKSAILHNCSVKISSKPPEIVSVAVDQYKVHRRFPDIPRQYPNNTVPILTFSHTKQITCLTNRKFTIKISQIPLSPAIAATVYKLQGTTCNAIVFYTLNEPERQCTSYMSLHLV